MNSVIKKSSQHVCRHTSQEVKWLLGPLKACNCSHLRYWLCHFYSSSRWFSWTPGQGSLTGGNAVNGFRHLLSVPCYNVSARTACWARQCVRVCMLEMAASVIIRVIPKLETVLELGMSFKGGISPVYWLLSLPIRQNISSKPRRSQGLTHSFLDVHHRHTGRYGLNQISR